MPPATELSAPAAPAKLGQRARWLAIGPALRVSRESQANAPRLGVALLGCGAELRFTRAPRAPAPPLRLVHGPGLFSRYDIEDADVVRLTDEPGRMAGVVKRHYGVVVARVAPDWTFASVHLSAFDEGAQTRRRQLAELLDWAQAEHARGRRVVIGGDFNYLLTETSFPHTTADEHLFWVHAFPREALPAGWTIAADPATPSNRTNQQPYVEGVNYRSVIDGFVVSPGVEVLEVRGVDLGFLHSDHQPVRLRIRAVP